MKVEKPHMLKEQEGLKQLGFEDFKKRATDESFNIHEKIGFPITYREGQSHNIIDDVVTKLTNLKSNGKKVLDLGCGCGELVQSFISFCDQQDHELCLVDSMEMLDQITNCELSDVGKISGAFPENVEEVRNFSSEGFDAILIYSVVQYPFVEGNLLKFIDCAASLLKEGGQLLIADIPNASMRNRFLSSPAGVKFHKEQYNPDTMPEVNYNKISYNEIDDGVIMGVLMRLRLAGFHTYIMPQDPSLPMANRREDILIVKP